MKHWLALLLAFAAPVRADVLDDLAAGRSAAGPQVVGLAVVVTDARHELRAEARGRRTIAPDAPMRADTAVRVASVSKLVVTLGVMRLVEERRLNLDADVSPLLGFPLRSPAFPGVPVTLRMLLAHRSGLSDATPYRLPLGATFARDLKPVWGPDRPGARFDYANINFGLAGAVMEAATGERFDRLMVRLVLRPLKLEACFNWSGCSAGAARKAATLYRKGADETAWDPSGPWVAQVDAQGARPAGGCPVALSPGQACDLGSYKPGSNGSLFSPQGGLRISARGLERIARLLLNRGTLDGVRLLRPESVDAMFAAVPVGRTGEGTYGGLMRAWGLGAQCMAGEGAPGADQPLSRKVTRWCGHLGEAYGLYSGIWIDRARGRGYVYVTTGTADDPAKWPAVRSRFMGLEEAILTDLAK